MTTHESITTSRIDLVDEQGVSRMTLAAVAPGPLVGGVEKERVAPFAGIVLRDEVGNERGGLGYLGGPGGRAVWALDNPSYDAIGAMVGDDGAVTFVVNQGPVASEDRPDAVQAATRFLVNVAADGTPTVSLQDVQARPRLRFTLREDGAGAIEFLDASGQVVHAIVPEHD